MDVTAEDVGAGITPACAGKSFSARQSGNVEQDHPRVCGEKVSNNVNVSVHRGSPPRVRGKVSSRPELHATFGITPACAGKS